MNYPKPDILQKKDIQVQARYFFVPGYIGTIEAEFFPGSRNISKGSRRALIFDTDIEGFAAFPEYTDLHEPSFTSAGRTIRRIGGIEFPSADNDTITLQIQNSSGIRQPVELFNAEKNALAANWGNRSGITITSNSVKSYAEIMIQSTNTQFYIGMVRTEVVSGADPRDFFSSPIKFVETDPAGNPNTLPLFQRPTNFQLHREIIDTNVRGVKINPFTSMELEMPPFTTIVLTIFKEPVPGQSTDNFFSGPSTMTSAGSIIIDPALQPAFEVLDLTESADLSLFTILKAKAAVRRQARMDARRDKRAAKIAAKTGMQAIREKYNIWPSKNPFNFDEDNG